MNYQFEALKTTPTFPKTVYNNLPPFLKQVTNEFSSDRQKDIILLSSLVVLGGCFSKLKGLYDNNWIHPNLFAFIIGPPAIGKGDMKNSKLLGKTIEDEYLRLHEIIKKTYRRDLSNWMKMDKKGLEDAGLEPDKPKLSALFIPGNTSSAALYSRLLQSHNTGIMFETEADVLTETIKQDWGGWSNIMRKAFHHETLSISRKGEDLLYNINKPRLSILLSGTPDQVPKLITSASNGLMSRFCFYLFNTEIEWRDPRPDPNKQDQELFFTHLSQKVFEIKTTLDSDLYLFQLTNEQYDLLNIYFKSVLSDVAKFDDNEAAATIKRLGLITFRIAMVLTVLRNMDKLDINRSLICNNDDFNIAIEMVKILLEHAKLMLEMMPQTETGLKGITNALYDALPNDIEFTTEMVNELGHAIAKIQPRQVFNHMQKLRSLGYIKHLKQGRYTKVDKFLIGNVGKVSNSYI